MTFTPANRASMTARMISAIANSPALASCRRHTARIEQDQQGAGS